MSERSFSDTHHRTVVKNPLLSSTVTGLSLEDLTHNAVLLPVAATPGVIPSQDTKVQNPPLENTDHATHNMPSGDASVASKQTINLFNNPTLNVQTTHIDKSKSETGTTVSNAPKKSDDDFDVNEYFARLQGTRYVSAPLNIKEDKNANLDSAEDNLEEINLNDTDKSNEDPQQSITADIAQNFSQLPTVLPQVASAVFSSFSNMLSMKSREHTPDSRTETVARQEKSNNNVQQSFAMPMGGHELSAPPREMVPPPREPPMMSGTGNFRITTKKKTYAQIPGLSSRDTPSVTNFNPPSLSPSNLPSFYVPHTGSSQMSTPPDFGETDMSKPNVMGAQSAPNIPNSANFHSVTTNTTLSLHDPTALETKPNLEKNMKENTSGSVSQETNYVQDEFSQTNDNVNVNVSRESANSNVQVGPPRTIVSIGFQPTKSVQANLFTPPVEPKVEIASSTSFTQAEVNLPPQGTKGAIIPPPPMFSNIPREDSETSVVKSVLPPSIARRISSHQPIIKQNTPAVQAFQHDNIFVPAQFNDDALKNEQSTSVSVPIHVNAFQSDEKVSSADPIFALSQTSSFEITPQPPATAHAQFKTESFGSNFNLQTQRFDTVPPPPNIAVPVPQEPLSPNSEMSTGSKLLPVQTFFNPDAPQGKPLEEKSALESWNVTPNIRISNQGHQLPIATKLIDSSQEPPKSLPLPPKLNANQSYRLAKKRPQYYSGPIEGVGAISNNVKPVMPPTESTSFHGAMFEPEQANVQGVSGLETSSYPAPFDISRPIETLPATDAYALSQPTSQVSLGSGYNTAFDLSRSTTDKFNPPEPEHKGFGIIGSLKSKLSSIDINKLQDKVTTFFDPAYNEVKPEPQTTDGSFRQLQNPYDNSQQNQASSYEIFVPSNQQQAIQDNATSHGYGYPTTEYSNYNQNLPTQYYEVQNANNFNVQSYYSNAEIPSAYFQQTQQLYAAPPTTGHHTYQPIEPPIIYKTDSNLSSSEITVKKEKIGAEVEVIISQSNIQPEIKHPIQTLPQSLLSPASAFSDANQSDITHSFSNLQITQESISVDHYVIENPQQRDNFTGTLLFNEIKKNESTKDVTFFDNSGRNTFPGQVMSSDKTQDAVEVSGVPLFNLSSMIADKTKESQESLEIKHAIPTEISLTKYGSVEKVSDLNICETCREVNKPEEKDEISDDLTSQLIENITSPIQLLNPVEVPLTEHNTPVDVSAEIDQLAEIAHITDETIETIHVQAVKDFLEETRGTIPEVNNYGWATSESCCPSNLLNESSFNYQVNPDAIGIFGTSSIFSNFPANASDEIKAEYKSTADEVVSPQIPSAPELENDTQSDETGGLDVHSIEQDATKDYPVFEGEEFIIEPSETDDDKIEYIEGQRKSSEDQVEEFDSFTHRVEKYKQMEESAFGSGESRRNSQILGATSPAITIASYFDTGNYAVETHFRNSLSSPPNMNVGSPNLPFSIPPGFEEEFKRRLSGLSSHDSFTPFLQKNNQASLSDTQNNTFSYPSIQDCELQDNFVNVPETQTQTHQISSTTYSSSVDRKNEFATIVGSGIPQSDFDNISETQRHQMPTTSYSTAGNLNMFSKDRSLYEGTSSFLNKNDFVSVPETDTQTHSTSTVTTATSLSNAPTSMDSRVSLISKEKGAQGAQEVNIFSFQDFSQNKQSIPAFEMLKPDSTLETNKIETSNIPKPSQESKVPAPPLPDPINFFSSNISTSVTGYANVSDNSLKEPKPTAPAPLPDPINFFSSTATDVTEDANLPENSFNRLASYFATPAKPEPSKPFFELSQSQNHYRHASSLNQGSSSINNTSNYLSEQFKSENQHTQPRINLQDIPHNQYIANLNLMKDLTSPENLELSPNSDQVVKTVNYFSVDYDIVDFKNIPTECKTKHVARTSKSDTSFDSKIHSETFIKVNASTDEKPDFTIKHDCKHESVETDDVTDVIYILANCKYCCDLINLDKSKLDDIKSKKFKVKMNMNASTETDNPKKMSKSAGAVPTTTVNSVTVNLGGFSSYDETNEGVTTTTQHTAAGEYTPVKHHWFYRVDCDGNSLWKGFSTVDSAALEQALADPNLNENTTVATDGGRFDVNVLARIRVPVYWSAKPTNVRRCSWFHKGTTDARYVPYSEEVADKLEEEYRLGVTTGVWHRRLQLRNNSMVIMHAPTYMLHLPHVGAADAATPTLMSSVFNKRVYRNPLKLKVRKNEYEIVDHLVLMVHGAGEYRKQMEKNQSTGGYAGVRRGCSECEIEDAEPSNMEHLLLLCHGIGSACDMRFRSVEEVVDDFRSTSHQLLQSHYKNSYDLGIVGRIEVLPISWHTTLHSGEHGVDRRLANITLDSIPRLRNFCNDTVLDVLFYTSPVYFQTILDTVCTEMNRIYQLFKARNPSFKGGVSLGGHSLGSVILYDLLCHQQSPGSATGGKSYIGGGRGFEINYPQLAFKPDALYAMGSPIAIFECTRGVESLGLDFALPTCKHFFNIFHPYDPIAYRIEPLINQSLKNVKPFLIPHHKGRKRMHLELKDTMARVGADIKQKIVESIRATWASVWRTPPPNSQQLEKVVEEEIEKEKEHLVAEKEDSKEADLTNYDVNEVDPLLLGRLNAGRRIDHVLQEAPFEMINEYLFAMRSHVCYWESEDTMLLILREVYSCLGVQPDCSVPQRTMLLQRDKDDGKPDNPSTSHDLQ